MVNLYVRDVEGLVAFYREAFGFETFRTPREGAPVHVELRLGAFVLGFASTAAAKAMHGLPLASEPIGPPRGEIALWTEDVDSAAAALVARGARLVSPPHDFIGTLRAAWLADPEGNHIQLVAKLPGPSDAPPGAAV
ncbi:VOC family protein [Inquilinus limosus]|uniref:VOC family protein n=1 Tax=Inquilinus limosus TaxID=171674 RepID=UPI0003F8692F|nr:VOC family protein [Inquilinus limosus]